MGMRQKNTERGPFYFYIAAPVQAEAFYFREQPQGPRAHQPRAGLAQDDRDKVYMDLALF